jgi:folate-binding protein YgfZ
LYQRFVGCGAMSYMPVMPITRLQSRALVRVSGLDWRAFLQGLLSNDVETLAEGELRFAALLTPQGKLLFDLFVAGEADGALLDVAADRRDSLIQRLVLYRLRAKVEIAPDTRAVFASWEQSVAGGLIDPRLPVLGWRLYGGAPGVDATEADYDAHRLSHGVPDPAHDAIFDKTYPIEANFDLLHGIDFRKGCFVGQETTSRMKRRGVIKNRMLPIRFKGEAPPSGAEVLNGELRAGEVLTGSHGRAMALVRLDRIDGALTVEGRAVSVEWPSWMPRG